MGQTELAEYRSLINFLEDELSKYKRRENSIPKFINEKQGLINWAWSNYDSIENVIGTLNSTSSEQTPNDNKRLIRIGSALKENWRKDIDTETFRASHEFDNRIKWPENN